MNLELNWRGPYGAGLFPQTLEAMAELLNAGVYLRIKRYAGERTVAYVGQSKQLLARMDQHVSAVLGLDHALRDETGRVGFLPAFDARFRSLNDIETVVGLALADARCMRFFCALCDDGFVITAKLDNIVQEVSFIAMAGGDFRQNTDRFSVKCRKFRS